MAKPITEAERQRIRQLHADGLGRNDIARELGRSAGVVSKVAAELGLSFDRAATEAATHAALADAKARRAKLMEGLLDDAERLRGQMFAPTTLHSFGGKDHTYETAEIPEPLFKDKRDIAQAVGILVEKSLRLDTHDSDDQGLAAVDAWLRDVMGS